MKDFKKLLEDDLNKQYVSPKILLSKLRLIEEESRKSPQYQDHFYLPFYYHLGKYIEPKKILQIGLNLGLEICCFLQSNNSTEDFYGFQNKDNNFYSERIAISNIKSTKKIKINYYYGQIYDQKFLDDLNNFDMVIINEKSNFDQINDTLDICWKYLNLDGVLVFDNVNYDKKINKIFFDFCKSQNREGQTYKTRYGTGIVQK